MRDTKFPASRLIRLEEKQKLRFHYGLTDRQLVKYVRIAGKAKGSTGQVLLQLLEMRLDNILFRLGMASTIPQARQLVNHRHILVNGRISQVLAANPEILLQRRMNKNPERRFKNTWIRPPGFSIPCHPQFKVTS